MKSFSPSPSINLHLSSWQDAPFQNNSVDLILTSPPYNIGSKAPCKYGRRSLGIYDSKSFGAIRGYKDDLPEDVYQQSQRDFLIACSKLIKDNGVILYNHKNRHKNRELISPYFWFPLDVLTIHDEAVLDRGSSHNNEKSFLQPTTERLYIFKKSRSAKIYFNKTKTKMYIHTKDIRSFPIMIDHSKSHHCAPFDLDFAKEMVFRYCPPEGTVCDPYSGSGTTMIASFLENRKFVGSEKEEKYFNMSVERFRTKY